ncbi:MAG: hypothetical protein ACLSVD_13615 [Eggerthellaceae bacterium]
MVGTNGKTTVTNLLVDSGWRASACVQPDRREPDRAYTPLLHAGPSDWGVFECDELWLAKILPQLQAPMRCCSTCSATSWTAW